MLTQPSSLELLDVIRPDLVEKPVLEMPQYRSAACDVTPVSGGASLVLLSRPLEELFHRVLEDWDSFRSVIPTSPFARAVRKAPSIVRATLAFPCFVLL
jgi:hypothetical protein